MEEFKRLKAYRKLLGITAQELADLLDINLCTYCNKENGKSVFTILECKKISDRVGKSIDELFFNQEVAL